MCISAAGMAAEFDGGEGTHEGVFVQSNGDHIIVYGNEAVAVNDRSSGQTADLDWDSSGYNDNRASCMLIVLPAAKGTFNPDTDLLDTSAYPDFLKDVVDSAIPKPIAKGISRGLDDVSFSVGFAGSVTHTEVGKFEVLTCTNGNDLSQVVSLVKNPRKRPPADRYPKPELGNALQQWYGAHDFLFVLAFFDGSDPSRSVLAARIKPRNPKIIVFPALDGHDPKVLPVPGARVERKHSLVVSVPGMVGGRTIHYSQDETVLPFMPPSTARGWRVEGLRQNGDWAIPVSDLTEGAKVRLFNLVPPGYNKPAGFRQEVIELR